MATSAAVTHREARVTGFLPPLHPGRAKTSLSFSPRPSVKHVTRGAYFTEEAEPSDAEKGLDYFTEKLEAIRRRVFETPALPFEGVRVLRHAIDYIKEDLQPFIAFVEDDVKVEPALKTRATVLHARAQGLWDEITAQPIISPASPAHLSHFVAAENIDVFGAALEKHLTTVETTQKELPDGSWPPNSFMDTVYVALADVQKYTKLISGFLVASDRSELNLFDEEEKPRFIEAADKAMQVAADIMYNFELFHNYIDELASEAAGGAGCEGKRADFEARKAEVRSVKEEVAALFCRLQPIQAGAAVAP